MELKTKFKMSYADLVQLADGVANLIQRDIVSLQKFGVQVSLIQDIKTMSDKMRIFLTDEELLGAQTKLTEEKNSLRAKVIKMVSDLMLRVRILYGQNTPTYNAYATNNIHHEDDANIVRTADRVVRLATKDLADLQAKGLTQAEINDLAALNRSFDTAIDAANNAKNERSLLQEQRVLLANKLYETLVEVCEYGKQVFKDTEPAKYENYVIYDMPSTEETPPAEP